MTKTSLSLNDINLHGGTQVRAEMNYDAVADYRDAYQRDDDMPPLEVFHDGSDYWLVDGFHRFEALQSLDVSVVDVIVHDGTRDDAVKWAYEYANRDNGLRLTNADKRYKVTKWIKNYGGKKLPPVRVIANLCGVSKSTVANIINDTQSDSASPDQGNDGETLETIPGLPEPDTYDVEADPPPPAPKPTVPTDEVGNPIDDDAVAKAFADVGELKELERAIQGVRDKLKQMEGCRVAAHVVFNQVDRWLKDAKTHLRYSHPYAVLPERLREHKQWGPPGFITKQQYEKLPEDQR